MTTDERKLKELMKKLDAHSVNIQEKHYIIRSPDDDMKLADALIATPCTATTAGRTLAAPRPSSRSRRLSSVISC